MYPTKQKQKPKEKRNRPQLNQGRLLGRYDDEDLYIISENQRMHCPKCNQYRFHDIYGTVAGEAIITVKIITHCRDCGFEVEQAPQPVGKVG